MTNHKQNSDIFTKTNILPSNTRNKEENIQCYNLLQLLKFCLLRYPAFLILQTRVKLRREKRELISKAKI